VSKGASRIFRRPCSAGLPAVRPIDSFGREPGEGEPLSLPAEQARQDHPRAEMEHVERACPFQHGDVGYGRVIVLDPSPIVLRRFSQLAEMQLAYAFRML